MFSFQASSVTMALQMGLEYLLHEGVEENSRNGKVLVAPGPVCTEYIAPRNRVLFSSTRDANPVFHFHEALWILSGSNDVMFVEYFAKNMRAYSDDGVTSWGAYGWRARKFYGWDQLEAIIAELKANPTSRRCVLGLWNTMGDYEGPLPKTGMCTYNDHDIHPDFDVATHGGLDVPCNTQIYFDARGGKVNMTVTNRSNDAIWGCYGANSVHFSFLLEYMAFRIGLPIGVYRQFSNNFHAYLGVFPREKMERIITDCYEELDRESTPTGPGMEPGFDEDLTAFMQWARKVIMNSHGMTIPAWKTKFFSSVAEPMFMAWRIRKNALSGQTDITLSGRSVEDELARVSAPDWRRACEEWILRRKK